LHAPTKARVIASSTTLADAASKPRQPRRIIMKKLSKRVRGASLVEYALLLVGILIIAAVAVKSIGPKVSTAASDAESHL
jgi:Flp pilus assembly pilin Flp